MKPPPHIEKVGLLGALFTAACCLGFPALISLVTALGVAFLINDAVLAPLLVGFLALTLWGLAAGWRRRGNPWPLIVGSVAAATLLLFVFIRQWRPGAYAAVAGLVVASVLNMIRRRRPMQGNRKQTELILTLVAFVVAAVPIFMLLLGGIVAMGSMGMSMVDVTKTPPDPAMQPQMMQAMHGVMAGYIPFALLPALIVFTGIWLYARTHYPRLFNRIGAGIAAGFLASIGLDVVRLIGVALGAFPGGMPTMFGQMILGRTDTSPSVLLAGYAYHALNGMTFGVMYTLLAGKARWPWGIAWGLFFELGMMTLPPVPMMAGPFGIHGFWPELFIASLIAHVVFGALLGVLAERWVRHEGTILGVLKRSVPAEPGEPIQPRLPAAEHAR